MTSVSVSVVFDCFVQEPITRPRLIVALIQRDRLSCCVAVEPVGADALFERVFDLNLFFSASLRNVLP